MGKDNLTILKPVAVSPEEEQFRKNLLKDLNDVLKKRLFCTCCLNDVKNKSLEKGKAYVHRLLGVLMCKSCYQYYGDGVFSVDEDGAERYCRWCGQGGLLHICSTCTASICKLCIDRNMSRTERKRVSNEDWQCYNCDPKPIYELRAMAYAFKTILDDSNGKKRKNKGDKDKNPDSFELQKKESCEIVVDAVKLIQRTCRSSDRKLAHMIKNLENEGTEKMLKLAEKLPNFVSEMKEELNSVIVKFSRQWADTLPKLLSVQDLSKSVQNGLVSDKEVLVSTMEEPPKLDENSCSDLEKPLEKNEKNINGEALSIDKELLVINEECSVADASENRDVDVKEEVSFNEAEPKPPMLRIRGIEEINQTVITPVKEKSQDKKNNSMSIIILSDSESSPEKKAPGHKRKLIDSNAKVSATCTKINSKAKVKSNKNIPSFPECTVDLGKPISGALNGDSLSTDKEEIASTDVPSKNDCSETVSEKSPRETNKEDAHDTSCPDEDKISKETAMKSDDDNSEAELADSSHEGKDQVKLNESKTDKNNKIKNKDKTNNDSLKNSKIKSSQSTDKESSPVKDTKADKKNSSLKNSDSVTIILNDCKSSSSSSSSESTTYSSASSCSEPEFVVEEKKAKKSRRTATRKAQIVKGLLTSSDSDLLSDDDSKKPKAGKRKTPLKSKNSPENLKKPKRKQSSGDENDDKEYKRLFNLNSLKNNQKRVSAKDNNDSFKSERNASKKTKEKVPSLLDEIDQDDNLWSDLRQDFGKIIKSLPGAEGPTFEILSMEDSAPSDADSEDENADESRMSVDSDDIENLFNSDKQKKLLKKKKDGKKVDLSDDDGDNKVCSNLDKNCKNDSWKNDKLLREKLSDDSSNDDIFTSPTKKKGRTMDVTDDSDEEITKKVKKISSVWTSDSDSSTLSMNNADGKKKRKRIKKASSDDSTDNMETSTPKGRKNIKKIKKSDRLNESTQNALLEEQERKKRIAERQQLYNELFKNSLNQESSKVDKLVLEFDFKTKKELISVDKDLVKKLKPHQASGIKFMWDSCFETSSKAKKSKGSGCILAHCMGLGKTLQVISLIHTLIKYDELNVKTVLVLCPLSTVLNWASEFEKWLSDVGSGQDVDVFHFSKSTLPHRSTTLRDWQRRGGVMIIGYSLFRTLVFPTKRIKPAYAKSFLETLTDPGPDLVICDEGHILKNEATAISKAVSKIKTLRRVVLTGTPLQNNLIEYHCMVQFVKPLLLGTKKEFTNRFVNPIQNGQFVDSTPQDVKVMKRRAHVLHKMLDGIVQRKDYNVLVPFLPPKLEYVLGLNLTPLQVKLYETYLEKFSSRPGGPETTGKAVGLFKDKSILHLICSHPRLLRIQSEQALLKKEMEDIEDEEGSLKDFIDDSTSSESDSTTSSSSSSTSISDGVSSKRVPRIRSRRVNSEEEAEEQEKEDEEENNANKEWWSDIISDEDMEDIKSSTKLFLLFKIIEKCYEIGDKLLVFSQSLFVLDLIEYFLGRIDDESNSENPPENLRGFHGTWMKGLDYFRLDGSSSSENRAIWCNKFNDTENFRGRLFLISTKAGGMGINLVGANRVVIFDASWNPSHDVQSIFRVFRFGQEKPCYIYRFLSKGTMEQKIYDRQVTKLSMSCRVIDEQQVDRHFSYADLNELYTFTPNDKDDKTFIVPKDLLLADILSEGKDLVLSYHSHDSLLENQTDEELNEEERQAAWSDFENEKKQVQTNMSSIQNSAGYYQYIDNYNNTLVKLKLEHPDWNEEQLRNAARNIVTAGLTQNIMAGGPSMMLQQNQQQQSQLQDVLLRQQQMMQQQRLWQMQQNQMLRNSLAQMQGNPRMMQHSLSRFQMFPNNNLIQGPQMLPRGQPQALLNPYAVRNKEPNVQKPVETIDLEKG